MGAFGLCVCRSGTAMEELMGRWKTLALTEHEDVEIDVRDKDDLNFLTPDNINLCVAAKVLISKKVNTEA